MLIITASGSTGRTSTFKVVASPKDLTKGKRALGISCTEVQNLSLSTIQQPSPLSPGIRKENWVFNEQVVFKRQ
jgi:hypothetical protein